MKTSSRTTPGGSAVLGIVRWLSAVGILGLLGWAALGCSSPTGPFDTGTIRVTADRESAPFTVQGPQTYTGTAPWTRRDVQVGTYTIHWGVVPGYLPPPDSTAELRAGDSVEFAGHYEVDLARVTAFHFAQVGVKRIYEVHLIPDTGPTYTVMDSLWRVYTDADGVLWAQSILKILPPAARVAADGPSASEETAITRRIGLLGDTLFLDPTLMDRVLVSPLQADQRWAVRTDSTILARIVGEEELSLGIGLARAWHVSMGAIADEWWAEGLGRVQYEEFDSDGQRVRGVLIAVDTIPAK